MAVSLFSYFKDASSATRATVVFPCSPLFWFGFPPSLSFGQAIRAQADARRIGLALMRSLVVARGVAMPYNQGLTELGIVACTKPFGNRSGSAVVEAVSRLMPAHESIGRQ